MLKIVMEIFLPFAGALSLSGLIGWGVLRLTGRIRSRFFRWPIYICTALLILASSSYFFLIKSFEHTFSDASIFSDRQDYEILTTIKKPNGEFYFGLELNFPEAIKVNSDSAIDILFGGYLFQSNKKPYFATLNSNKAIELWTNNSCDSKTIEKTNAGLEACATISSNDTTGKLRWFIRSDSHGQSLLTILLPREISGLVKNEHGQWSGTISHNDSLITYYVDKDGNIGRGSIATYDRSRYQKVPVLLSSKEPLFRDHNIEIDFGSLSITFPVDFITTVGMSGTTYFRLALIAAVFSSMLGSGWLWKLIEWLQRSRNTNEPSAHDLVLFAEFQRKLPADPTIRFLGDLDFGNSFLEAGVRPLYDFADTWGSVDKEFIDGQIETMKKLLFDKAHELVSEIGGRTTQVGKADEDGNNRFISVYPDGIRAKGKGRPQHVLDDARFLNEKSTEFVPEYEKFVRFCKIRLKL